MLGPTPQYNSIVAPAARLAAAIQPFDPDRYLPATDVVATALADATGAAAPSVSDGIIGVYLTIEQWVQYGVDFLSWALRWVPFGGLLASQLNMVYDLGESIVRSMVFNTAYFLDGTVGFGEALSNIGSATSDAFSTFVNAQAAWVQGLLPPRPPAADALVIDPGVVLSDPGVPTDPTDLAADFDGIALSVMP